MLALRLWQSIMWRVDAISLFESSRFPLQLRSHEIVNLHPDQAGEGVDAGGSRSQNNMTAHGPHRHLRPLDRHNNRASSLPSSRVRLGLSCVSRTPNAIQDKVIATGLHRLAQRTRL